MRKHLQGIMTSMKASSTCLGLGTYNNYQGCIRSGPGRSGPKNKPVPKNPSGPVQRKKRSKKTGPVRSGPVQIGDTGSDVSDPGSWVHGSWIQETGPGRSGPDI